MSPSSCGWTVVNCSENGGNGSGGLFRSTIPLAKDSVYFSLNFSPANGCTVNDVITSVAPTGLTSVPKGLMPTITTGELLPSASFNATTFGEIFVTGSLNT